MGDNVDVLSQALVLAGFSQPDKVADTRTTVADQLAVTATVADAGKKQTLLVSDAHGGVTFHLPAARAEHARMAAVADGAAGATFLIPRERLRAAAAAVPPGRDGLALGQAALPTLQVLEHSVVDDVGGAAEAAYAARELALRPYRVRAVQSAGGTFSAGDDITSWDALSGGTALLFVHGIFSSADDTFHGLPNGTVDALLTHYGHRVFCFDHPTVTVSPEDNIRWLLNEVGDTPLSLDVIAHSRGGLVSRILAGQLPTLPIPSTIRVDRIAFAGTPNAGTEIADVPRWGALIDRLANLIKFAPEVLNTPAVFLADLLEVLKAAASDVAVRLPGLECMTESPLSQLITSLNGSGAVPPNYFAIDTDFRADDFLHHIFDLHKEFVDGAEILVDDAVFQHVPNDVAVPTSGIGTAVSAAGFPIPNANTHHFGKAEHVWHCSYFEQAPTADCLLSWFTG